MSQNNYLIVQMVALVQCNPEDAAVFLSGCSWDLETAVDTYYTFNGNISDYINSLAPESPLRQKLEAPVRKKKKQFLSPEKFDPIISHFLRTEKLNDVNGFPDQLLPVIQSYIFRCIRLKFFKESQVHTHYFCWEDTLKAILLDLEAKHTPNKRPDTYEGALIHLFLPFKYVRHVFPLDHKRMTVNIDEFDYFDQDKLTEIPDDYLTKKIISFFHGEAEPIPWNQVWLGERFVKKENEDENELESYVWEMTQNDEPLDLTKLGPGDIINVCDSVDKWYESVVRAVGTPQNGHEGSIAIHYIGWMVKWDEWIDITNEAQRFAKRYTKAKHAHRPKSSWPELFNH